MTAAKKSISVCEFVPKGCSSWTDYYQKKNSIVRSLLEAAMVTASILILVFAYCVAGALEMA